MEAISGRKTIQEIAADHAIHPIRESQWKRQLLDGASELFTRGKKSKDKQEGEAKEAELFQQIGKLQMELESGLIQSVSQAFLPRLRAWVEVGWIALSQCLRASLPQPISI